jgi:hypothetical protein
MNFRNGLNPLLAVIVSLSEEVKRNECEKLIFTLRVRIGEVRGGEIRRSNRWNQRELVGSKSGQNIELGVEIVRCFDLMSPCEQLTQSRSTEELCRMRVLSDRSEVSQSVRVSR